MIAQAKQNYLHPDQRRIIAKQAAADLAERRLMRENLAPFIKKAFATVDPAAAYKHNWHIDLISEYLEACYYREINKLIINMPPRFMKSICATVAFPAWVLGRKPSEQILCGSYSGKLSLKHSVDTRLIIDSPWFKQTFPDVQLAVDQNEKSKFQTTQRGHRIATSVGGTATGEGGNYLILDDPINPKEALSESDRKSSNDWFDQTWSSRKNDPKTAIEIIVMQRLHTDDTTGHALEQGGWEHLVIPQEAEKRTIVVLPRTQERIIRPEKSLLHEERFGPKENDEAKIRLGSYGYAGQQQQSPIPLGGGRIKLDWFPRYRELPESFDEIIISMDTANKPKEINDPSVAEVFGRKDAQWYLLDLWKDRVTYPTLKTRTMSLCNDHSPDGLLIEDKASGQSLIQELREGTDLPVVAIEPEADKITRLDTQTPSLEAGMVALPDPAFLKFKWLNDLETHLSTFPNPNAWDELDALSQFVKYIRARKTKNEDLSVPFSVTSSSNWRS